MYHIFSYSFGLFHGDKNIQAHKNIIIKQFNDSHPPFIGTLLEQDAFNVPLPLWQVRRYF